MEVGEEGDYIYIYISLHCHHQNDSCIKKGSNKNHFNVSFIVRDKVTIKTVSTKHNLFEEKGEPKRYRTEVLLSTYQPNALPLGQTGSQEERKRVVLIFNCWD